MAIIYNQTANLAAVEAVSCSGAVLMGGGQEQSSLCSVGGTPAGSPVVVGGSQFDAGAGQAGVMFEIVPPAGTVWAAGNWTVRLNVTTGSAAACTWTGTFLCRHNSSNVNQGSFGSLTGQTTAINTTGVKSHVVSGSSQTPSAGDKVYIVLVFSSPSANQQFSVQFDQAIDSPFTSTTSLTADKGSMSLAANTALVFKETILAERNTALAFTGKVAAFETIAGVQEIPALTMAPYRAA